MPLTLLPACTTPTPRIQKAIYASDNEVSFQYEIMEKPLFQ